jgi:hypothetical protein
LLGIGELGHLSVNREFIQLILILLALLLRKCNHLRKWDLDARQPGDRRLAVFDPVVVLLDAFDELVDPGRQFLVGEGRECLPGLGDEPVENHFVDYFQVGGHADEALDHVRNVLQVATDAFDQFVDLLVFLFDHYISEVDAGVFGVVAAVLVDLVKGLVFFLMLLEFGHNDVHAVFDSLVFVNRSS